MGLDSLVDGTSSDDYTSPIPDDYSPPEPDSLRKWASVTYQKPKLHNPYLCPNCGEDNTEKNEYYRRCKNDNCETLTYIPRQKE